ncbi:CDP-glycerol glycerophosphotransferase family protein [Listeria newyorkensis]|uniref:Glycerophosphotransferase n=1 Tax=Listeria newyorkensis TaxID=1497681 RepID=A0A841YX67_9LIST|nr:CDP-glycerol glycerophosphotransferase family protein [Listeria newyorkensis]MBC1457166.1 glycerophosphotransferase [Listeria newyorkensis]
MIQRIKQTARLMKKRLEYGCFSYHHWLRPIEKNKIVVSAYYGGGYADSPKAIVAELLPQGFDIVWLVRDGQEKTLPAGVRPVRYGSKQAIHELATAKIWLDNCRQKYSPPKRKQQVYFQTWHGSLALKKIEKDAAKQLQPAYLDRAKRDAKKCDYMMAGSDFCERIYTDSFWFRGEVLASGTPRCDALLKTDAALTQYVAEAFQSKPTTKFALYAPTFRQGENLTAYLQDFTKVHEALQNRFGGEWKILVRLHPNVAKLAKQINYGENILNATDYPDMQELLAVSEWLITDYSSSMFDMAIAGKKVVLYTPDLDNYLKKERAMYFDLKELPFQLTKTPEALVSQMEEFDEADYHKKLAVFQQHIGSYETGNASVMVADKIKEIIAKG